MGDWPIVGRREKERQFYHCTVRSAPEPRRPRMDERKTRQTVDIMTMTRNSDVLVSVGVERSRRRMTRWKFGFGMNSFNFVNVSFHAGGVMMTVLKMWSVINKNTRNCLKYSMMRC